MLLSVVIDRRGKTLAEAMLVFIIVLILMDIGVTYFQKHQNMLLETGFNNLKNFFSARISAVHAQWMMDGKPNKVKIKYFYLDEESPVIVVNKFGWVDFGNEDENCRKIWQAVTESPLLLMNHKIQVRTYNKYLKSEYCQYVLDDKFFFTYHLAHGRVSQTRKII